MTDEELLALYERVDNAGRWGRDDELGTLNFITPAKRQEASQLVVEGVTISLALPMRARSERNGAHVEHTMLQTIGSADDEVKFVVHQEGFTHIDCPSHIASHHGRAYNHRRFQDAVTTEGVQMGSVRAQSRGIFSRGVLLDLPEALGVERLDAGEAIMPEHLECAEAHAEVCVTTGDVLVLRTGVQRDPPRTVLRPGPGAECIEWLCDRQVAVYTGDSPERITPEGARILGLLPEGSGDSVASPTSKFPLPFHQIAIPAMGLTLIDFCAVEELAHACEERGRYEFLFVAAPLPIEGGTGSPVNPLAVF